MHRYTNAMSPKYLKAFFMYYSPVKLGKKPFQTWVLFLMYDQLMTIVLCEKKSGNCLYDQF